MFGFFIQGIPKEIKQGLIVLGCIFHMAAISWWSLPREFAGPAGEFEEQSFDSALIEALSLNNHPGVKELLELYVDLTGSQQYWDFFAPQSPRYHQYLSVCRQTQMTPELGKITCQGDVLFSNFDNPLNAGALPFRFFGSGRSRHYRLTENLAKLQDTDLLTRFTAFYRPPAAGQDKILPVQLILHQFELHPELADLTPSGYRMDQILLTLP